MKIVLKLSNSFSFLGTVPSLAHRRSSAEVRCEDSKDLVSGDNGGRVVDPPSLRSMASAGD
jgi:hypothetical protein